MRIDCICPPKGGKPRHPKGDTVTLRDALDFEAVSSIRWAAAIQQTTDPGVTYAEMFGLVSKFFVLYGIGSWSVVDAEDKPVEVSPNAIRTQLLIHPRQASIVADAADDKFGAVMRPLLIEELNSSPDTPTDESTSPPTASSEKPQKPSKPSSISTIPTVATEVTASSLDGDFNSSPSSASAA